jgi:fructose-1,6-bisphosphatase-3
MRRPDFQMEDRCLLHRISPEKGTITMPDGREYPLRDTCFPTIDWEHPYELTDGEKDVMDRLRQGFCNCEKLQRHIRFLLDKGGLYKVYNNNLLFHGSIPLKEDGTFEEVRVYGKTYKGKELYDVLEAYVRRAFYETDPVEQEKGRDILWFIWAAPNSPLFGKSKMSTFERYFIEDKETHTEKKKVYYRLLENEEVVGNMLREFGLDPQYGRIINGHVPVHQTEGESPVKCNGKVIVIDGGLSKAYHKVTGIAGYTLIYNSYGLMLCAHEPFTSAEEAVSRESDIVSRQITVHYSPLRLHVADTDTGAALRERIAELRELLEAYRRGIIKEKK